MHGPTPDGTVAVGVVGGVVVAGLPDSSGEAAYAVISRTFSG